MSVTALRAEAPETPIALLIEENPGIVLQEPAKLAALYDKMKADIAAHVPDLSTEKSRKAIGSLAYKIARTKTAIDDAGKKLNEDLRKEINVVDAKRREIRDTLDGMRDQVRKPLDDWEAAEEQRENDIAELRSYFQSARILQVGTTAAQIAERMNEVRQKELPADDVLRDAKPEILELRTLVISDLLDARTRTEKAEADAAELERLREEQRKRELEEIERQAAADAESRRVEAEKAEQERLAAAAEKARLDAIAETERKAREEKEALERKHQAELDRIERDRKAEADRIAQEQVQQEAEARRVKAEADRRAADKAHRATVMRAVKEALMEAGEIDEASAKQIVMALVSGAIPHTTIAF